MSAPSPTIQQTQGKTLSQRFPRLPQWIIRACDDDSLFALAVVITVLVALLGVVGNLRPANDVAGCYAKQVREFAAGNWEGAFFHMTPPLVIVLAGSIAKFLWIPPFAALKLVSGAMLVASLWPLRRLLRRTLPPEWVPYGCLMFCACGRLARYATMGLLDVPKSFFLLWLVTSLCAYADRPTVKRAVWIAVWVSGLSLARAEGVFFLPGVGIAMLVFPLLQVQTARKRSLCVLRTIAHGLLIAVIAAVLFLPQILYVQAITGYPALDSRQSWKVRTLLAKAGWAETPNVHFFQDEIAAPTARVKTVDPADVKTVWRSLREAAKGLDVFILSLALLGISLAVFRRSFTRWDCLYVGVVVYNILLFLSNGFITKRYTTPTCPFLIPYAVLGLAFLTDRLLVKQHVKAFRLGLGILVFLGFWDGLSRVRPSLPLEPNLNLEIGTWIASHRSEFLKSEITVLHSHPEKNIYHDGRQPVIAAMRPQIAYWAEADWVGIDGRLIFKWEELQEYLLAGDADLLVVDARFLATCPDFRPGDKHLRPVPGVPQRWGVDLFRICRSGNCEGE